MKIATFNINGINGRLTILLKWLKEASPDVVCLQELKAPDDRFPKAALKKAGYHAIWHGQKAWNGVAILSKKEIQEVRRGLPGDPDDSQSRYIEAITFQKVIGCIYLPNGNPYPGLKFDYKIKWFKRFAAHAKKLMAMELPVLLVGDYNVMPTALDVYKPEKYLDNALFRILRLDHFLLSPMVADHLKRGGVDKYVRGWEQASDHAPAWIEIT